MDNFTHVADNIKRLQDEISAAALNAGRESSDIQLIAVTKTYPAEAVIAAFHAGITHMGENRVQEAVPKIDFLSQDLSLSPMHWHLIGSLQRNKARQAVESFDLIHSVDSVRLAKEINKHAAARDKMMGVLLQVNVSGEESKSGFTTDEAADAVGQILADCEHVTIKGLMTMAPLADDAEAARPTFQGLRELRETLSAAATHARLDLKELSMGMSNDYRVAIEEGATMVRIGTAIFGRRT